MRKAHSAKSAIRFVVLSMAFCTLALVFDQGLQYVGVEASLVSPAQAQEQKKKTRALPGIKESTMKKLGEIQELASPDTEENPNAEPNFPEALKQLDRMIRDCRDKCNQYELAQVYRFYAFVYYSMDDYQKAIGAYKNVLAQSPEIPYAVELDALTSLAQLSYASDNVDDALKYLDQWMELSRSLGREITADKYFMRGTYYFTSDRKRQAQDDVNLAVTMVEDEGKVAKEQWYNLQLALYLDQEDYKTSLPIAEKLIRNYPKKKYWVQYANLNGLVGKDAEQLAALDVSNVMGGLEQRRDYVNLASLYMQKDVPYEAAEALESGMRAKIVPRDVKNLEILGNAYRAAKEFEDAIKVMTEAASKAAEEDRANRDEKNYTPREGKIYATLVSLYSYIDDHKSAVEAGKKALAAGNLRSPCEVHTDMGISYVDLEQYGAAVQSFEKAKEDKTCRQIVNNWIRYAQREQQQQQALRDAML